MTPARAAALLLLSCACSRAPAAPPVSLLLVTIDTLRADHVGVYGAGAGATPQLDALAARGALFEEAVAAAPLTLPSHATILSGLEPPHHGVRDNGSYAFPEGVATLATQLEQAGYATGAFVAAYVLDRRFGLARGFDTYDDRIARRSVGGSVLESERPCDKVVVSAETWLAERGGPFFAWAHFYEPHAPYAGSYADEVRAADACFGRLLRAAQAKAGERLLVAVLADHGEGLGEHAEPGHGLFVYQSTLRIPLLFAGPGVARAERRKRLARTSDVAPTLLALLGRSVPVGLDGRDLFTEGAPLAEAYAESFYPASFGWSPLRALRVGALKLVEAPRPELYDLGADPKETRDLASARQQDVARLRGALQALLRTETRAAPRASDPEVAERLRALGYAAGPGGVATAEAGAGKDPKDALPLFLEFERANAADAPGALQALVAREPGNATFRRSLAAALRRAGRNAEAVAALGDLCADTGRANGGTLKVVTKSGTNDLKGSAYEFFRDKGLNSQTETEKINNRPKGDYRRHQFGASLGGPIRKDRTHFFGSFERIQQDTTQSVNTRGLFPDKDGVYALKYTENMGVGKLTHQLNPNNFLSVRYGYNDNGQPYGTSTNSPPESWGDSQNKFHSANVNLNSSLGGGRLNEFVYQYSYFRNHISENSNLPTETFPNGVNVGASVNTPQTTEQHKHQFRDDFTWIKGRHDLRAGVSFIYEPTLEITFSTGQQPQFSHLADSRTSPISSITFNGSIGGAGGGSIGSIPNNQYSFYLQDGWRVNNKLTLDIGVRYDLVTGFAFDQTKNIIFADLQAAAARGVFSGSSLPCPCVGFEDFGKTPTEDKNNIAPRVGFTYDVKGDGGLVLRGGVGRYYDFAYTNANILFAVIGAQSSFGQVYSNTNSSGVRNADGSLYQVGQPLPPSQLTNVSAPLPSHAASPRIKQPFTDQANLGFSKQLGRHYAVEVDGTYASGRDLGTRPRLNVRIGGGNRRFLGILPVAGNANFNVDTSDGISHYKGVNLAVRRRFDGKLGFLAWYSLSKSESSASLRATDEFGEYTVINAFDPFNQEAPTRTDARHRFNFNGTWSPGYGVKVSPIFRYRSKTPFNAITGTDDNRDGVVYDLPSGVTTLNSRRGADFKQFDLRLSKSFNLTSSARFELIGEAFNLTNAKNPGGFIANMTSAQFGRAQNFAGDFQRGEQRIFQLAARIEF